MPENFIEQLQKGNENAFRQLVDEYQQMVFRTCLGIVHDTEDADDIAQEVFIEAYQSIYKFRANSKISTWLYRIAVNKSLNFLRANKRKRLFQSINKSTPEIPDDNNNLGQPHEKMLEQQRKKIMDNAIDSLPKNQRTAFVLNKVEELSYKEISEIMELSISSVESLLFRAKKNLQKKLLACYHRDC